ncbi:MAG: transcription elongation factor GreA [Patescibacteria group bacterium]
MRQDKEYISQEKRKELEAELVELKTNKRRAVADRLEFAKSMGDLAENAEYHAARDEQADTENRIIQIENILKNSVIVSSHHSSKVEVGSGLLVKKPDGSEWRVMIVGSEEADIKKGKISYLSPLGEGLLGRQPGDLVEIITPRGPVKYQIISID